MNTDFTTLSQTYLARPEVQPPVKIDQGTVNYIQELIVKGGPEPYEYPKLLDIVDKLDDSQVEELRELLRPALNESSLQGWTFHKPMGYAGDFIIIEKIYENFVNPDFRYKNWDRFYHEQDAAKAVINRKSYFIDACEELIQDSSNEKHVLVLGSGPATDVYEFMKENPNCNLTFDLIDWDERAVEYAKEKNLEFLGKINLLRMNVLRYVTHKRYDLIWSAGLFDYFKEKHFVYLVKKFVGLLAGSGEMIIGNFSIDNPTRRIMEVMGDWYLNYRSENELLSLGVKAGIEPSRMAIDREPLGINLFLKIKNY